VASLINQAQVYRYLPKPLRKGLLGKSLESTVERYRQLQAVPVLREAVKVEKNENVQEQAAGSRIAEYLRRLRGKGFGSAVASPA